MGMGRSAGAITCGGESVLKRMAGATFLCLALLSLRGRAAGGVPFRAPEFPTAEPSRWVGAPVRMGDLRGKVVLLDVWTFG